MQLAIADRVARPRHCHDDGVGLEDDQQAQVVALLHDSTTSEMGMRGPAPQFFGLQGQKRRA